MFSWASKKNSFLPKVNNAPKTQNTKSRGWNQAKCVCGASFLKKYSPMKSNSFTATSWFCFRQKKSVEVNCFWRILGPIKTPAKNSLYVLQNHWLIYWKIPISGIRFSQIGRWDLRSKIGMKIPHNRRRPWIFGKQTYWKIHPGKQTAGWNSKIRGLEDDGFLSIEWFVPATSKGCQLNSKGWWIDTL